MQDIVITRLSKSFGDKPVLRELSLSLPAGKILCLMAPSGAGKTTLARILLGLDRADSGEITGLPARVSAQFQEDRLSEGHSVLANLRFALGRGPSREALVGALAELSLSDAADTPVRNLSGGMRRRVALARAVLFPSELLVLDEPFKGLDEAARADAVRFLLRRQAGRTVLVITHDAREAELLGAPIFTLPAKNV